MLYNNYNSYVIIPFQTLIFIARLHGIFVLFLNKNIYLDYLNELQKD